MKKLLAYLSLIFGISMGGILFGFLFMALVGWLTGGTERVAEIFQPRTGEDVRPLEWFFLIIGLAVGAGLGALVGLFVIRRTGWLSEGEITRLLK